MNKEKLIASVVTQANGRRLIQFAGPDGEASGIDPKAKNNV